MSGSYDQSEQTVKAENSIPLDSKDRAPTVAPSAEAVHTFQDDTIQDLMSKPVKDGVNYMVSMLKCVYEQISVEEDTANDFGRLQTIFKHMNNKPHTPGRDTLQDSSSVERAGEYLDEYEGEDPSGVKLFFQPSKLDSEGSKFAPEVLEATISSAEEGQWDCDWWSGKNGDQFVTVTKPVNDDEEWRERKDKDIVTAQFTDMHSKTFKVKPLLLSLEWLQPLSKPPKSDLPQGDRFA